MHSKTMWNKQRYCGQLHSHVLNHEFPRRWPEKLPYSENFRTSSWSHDMEGDAKKCVGDIVSWQTRRLNNSTKYQLHASMTTTLERGRNEICRRIVTSMLWNCSKMFILGTNWMAWYSMVSEQTCTIDYKMDQSMWQTISSIDLLHSSHIWIQTVLLCR